MYISPAASVTAGTISGGVGKAEAAASALSGKEDRELEKACQEMEAVFLSILWREMQKSTGTDLGGWSTIVEQAIGQSWARSGGIGLAKVIYEEMSKHPKQ